MADFSGITYDELIDLIANYYKTDSQDVLNVLNNYGIQYGDMENAYKLIENTPYQIVKNADDTIRTTTYTYTAPYVTSAEETATALDSNVQVLTKTRVNIPFNTYPVEPSSVENELVEYSTGMTEVATGTTSALDFITTEVSPAIAAVSTGIMLGKAIDSALYNANPDFWDSHGMSSLDPKTWDSITQDDDSINARVFNMIFGINPETKTAQAYLDEDAITYLALYLNDIGVIDGKYPAVTSGIPSNANAEMNYMLPISFKKGGNATLHWTSIDTDGNTVNHILTVSGGEYSFTYFIITSLDGISFGYSLGAVTFGIEDFTGSGTLQDDYGNITSSGTQTDIYWDHKIYTAYYNQETGSMWNLEDLSKNIASTDAMNKKYYTGEDYEKCKNFPFTEYAPYIVCDGLPNPEKAGETIEGITDQEGADLPDTSTWGKTSPMESTESQLARIKQYLKDHYKDTWTQGQTQKVVQTNGTITEYKYIPVGLPVPLTKTDTDTDDDTKPKPKPQYNPKDETKVKTGTQTQTKTQIKEETAPAELTQTMTETASQTQTKTDTTNPNPPGNTTGTGITPPVVIPPSKASSLYAIYNPTLTQLNDLGSWLWSSDFVDQLLKVFSDPMQAIIGLHKVYATPATSGTQNIKVGYLDSGVSSKVVSNQYTTIDCGSVTVSEFFGNVLDYSPYTEIQLYLPFIGIVNLDTADVMRSKISVTYHVDVLTGACLADVKVIRDASGGVLYQYAGNAAVTLPVSSGSYMGIVASLASIAGGVAGTLTSGGAVAPMLLGAAGSALNAHTKVEHSGGFSGNTGAMGAKIPYLIISRPQSELASSYQQYLGNPANKTVTVGNCSGFVKFKEIHLEGLQASGNELQEIESLMTDGIII